MKYQKEKNLISRRCDENGVIGTDKLMKIFGTEKTNTLNYHLKKLIQEGFLTKISDGKGPGQKKLYRINDENLKYFLKYSDSQETHDTGIDEGLKNQKNEGSVNFDPTSYDEFDNMEMPLTSKGHVIPVVELGKAIEKHPRTIRGLITRNKLLFQPYMIDVNIKGQDHLCLTREGVLVYLVKVPINSLNKEKQEKVLRFQRWVIEKLGELMIKGKVQLHPSEHQKVHKMISKIF